MQQKITPFLWFEKEAEEAAKYYVAIFSGAPNGKDSKIVSIMHYSKEGAEVSKMPLGTVMTVEFKLDGQDFVALNGGHYFKFSGAISFVINCESQEEIDYFWEKLSAGGEEGVCGWINHDKYGVTWQVVPVGIGKLIGNKDPEKAKRAMTAMIKMKKLNIKALEEA